MENIVCLDDLLQDVNHLRSSRQQVLIYIREKIHDEFIDFLGGKGINSKYAPGNVEYRFDKFLAIAAVIYRNTYCAHRYRLENSDPVVTAMKFMDKGRNDRVYCREMTTVGGKVVILCEIHKKKNNENKKKEKNIIKKVAEYEFKIHS